MTQLCCCSVAKPCLPPCDPMDCILPPGSSVHGILQASILEWVAISFSRGSSQTRDQTHVSCIGRRILYHWATREDPWWNYTNILKRTTFIRIDVSIKARMTTSYAKTFDCVDHNKLENSERDGNTRPPELPLEKPVCRSGSNSYNWTWNNRLVPNRKRSTSRLYIVALLI